MEQDFAYLIRNYALKKKEIDTTFINETIRIVRKHLNLFEYIRDIKPLNNKTVYARYNRATKTIYINYNKLHEYLDLPKNFNSNNCKITEYYQYILFIQLILHEVMHAKQYKQFEEYKYYLAIKSITRNNETQFQTQAFTSEDIILYSEINAFESLIEDIEEKRINIIKGYIQGYLLRKKYEKLYDYSPSEKLAFIDSTHQAINIANILGDEHTSTLMQLENYEAYLCGYQTIMYNQYITEPTKFYLDRIKSNSHWQKIYTLSQALSDIERIRLGLKTNPEQLYKLENSSKKLILQLEK